MDNRKHMGENRDGVMFPVAPNLSEMSDSYMQFIEKRVGEPKLLIEWPKI